MKISDYNPGYGWWLAVLVTEEVGMRGYAFIRAHRSERKDLQEALDLYGDRVRVYYRPTGTYFTGHEWALAHLSRREKRAALAEV